VRLKAKTFERVSNTFFFLTEYATLKATTNTDLCTYLKYNLIKERSAMPKKIFWPATLIVMGLIILAAILDLLPSEFMNFWPLMLIIVGLGGLLTADRDEWMSDSSKKSKAAPKSNAKSVKKTAKSTSTAKSTNSAKSKKNTKAT
jgi:hypothetical protein